MCMCLARGWVGGVGGEWVRELGLGFTNPERTWGNGICVCVLRWCGWSWEGVGCDSGFGPGSGRCSVCVCWESGLFVLMAGRGICILC